MLQILHRPRNLTRSRHRLSVRSFVRTTRVRNRRRVQKGKKKPHHKNPHALVSARNVIHSVEGIIRGLSPRIALLRRVAFLRSHPPCTRLAYGRPARVGDVSMKQKIEAPSDQGPRTKLAHVA